MEFYKIIFLLVITNLLGVHTDDETCGFENDFCIFTFNETKWMFQRMNSEEVSNTGGLGPPSDHLQNTKGKFLWLNMEEDTNITSAYSYLISAFLQPNFKDNHIRRCFSFWFMILDENMLQDLYISVEDEFGIPTDIWRYKETSEQEWKLGQVKLDMSVKFKIRIVALRTNFGPGFIAFDDYTLRTDFENEDCPTSPPGAAINPSTTTTTSSHDTFPDCTFTNDMCSWFNEGNGLRWSRGNSEEFESKGENCPIGDIVEDKKGYYMLLSKGTDEGPPSLVATLSSTESKISEIFCMRFDFNIFKDGGFTSFRIRTNTSEGLLKTVWELTDHAMFADNRWMVGQVQVNSKLILFEAVHELHPVGYIALDNIQGTLVENDCEVLPKEAILTTESPVTTSGTTPGEDFPVCDFENSNCGWTSNQDDENRVWWSIGSTGSFNESKVQCPDGDFSGSSTGKYVLANHALKGNPAILSSQLVNTDAKFCMMFQFNIPHEGSFNHLLVKTLDPSGAWITVWELSDMSLFADSEWLVGQVEVYSKQIQFEAFKTDAVGGWVAIDNIINVNERSCIILPHEAEVSTIPSQSTTQQGSDLACDFSSSLCFWTSNFDESESVFWVKGNSEEFESNDISSPTAGRHDEKSEYYVLAEPKRQGDYAILTSQRVDTETTACMGFYFSLTAMGEWTQLSVLTAVDSETMAVVWDLSDKTLLADGLWIYGQTKVNTRQVQIIATKGDGTNGWAALDDITMENDDVCSTIPENAATPTSSQETTKTPDKFPRCSFESGTCEWTSNKNEAGEEWWQRNTSHILNVGENTVGPESDFEGHEDGFYMIAVDKSKVGEAVLSSPYLETDAKTCLSFWFNLFRNGDFVAMRISTIDPHGENILVYNLRDTSAFADDTWIYGQVEVYSREVSFIVEVIDTIGKGWAAVDEILDVDIPLCTTVPAEAAVSTIPPDTTTPIQEPELSGCDFEKDECGWTVDYQLNNTETFMFVRARGIDFQDNQGPTTDHLANKEAYFLWASSRLGLPGTVTGIISTELLANSKFCVTFWFDIPHDEGIQSLEIFTISPSGGNKNLLWSFSTKLDFWEEGRVLVTNHENYQVVFEAVKGNLTEGYIAIDDIVVTKSEDCQIKPTDASPTTPGSETTIPNVEQPNCNFDNGLCDWILEDTEWKWKRVSLAELAEEGKERPKNADGYFLYASGQDGDQSSRTLFRSPSANSRLASCMKFKYSIYHEQGISALRIFTLGEDFEFQTIWALIGYTQDTNEFFVEGQVAVSGKEVIFEIEGGSKRNGYVAVDEITFENLENCETIPNNAEPSVPKFPDCNFEAGLCNWKIEESLWKWERTNLNDLESRNETRPGNAEGSFMFSKGWNSEDDMFAILSSPKMESATQACISFKYSILHAEGISSLAIMAETGTSVAKIWELSKANEDTSKLWFEGRVHVDAAEIYFVVDGGSAFNGYAGVDNILFQDVQEDCTVIPSYAAPITTTPKPNTTPKPTPNFQSCNFEEDTCEFISPKDPKWVRVTVEDLENLGKPVPAGNDRGYFMYASGDEGSPGTSFILESDMHSSAINTCFHFLYSIQHDGGFTSLRIKIQNQQEQEEYVWELSDTLTNSHWEFAQVHITAHKVTLEAVRGDGSIGYVSIDDLVFVFNESPELCSVFPENAAVNSTGSTPTDGSTQTTPTPENFQSCGFEENTCEYSSPSKDKWIRTNAEELSNSDKPVPGGIDKGYFAYVSGDLGEPKSTLLLESKMHDETIATCMHFFYNIQQNGSFKSLRIKIQDHDGYEEYLWELSSVLSNGDWEIGQVYISAPRIIIEAEKGDGTSGYIAVDDLLFVKEESSSACTVFPPEAVVTPTEHPPTDGTTHIPPTIFCEFETDFCGYEVTGHENFMFIREKGNNFNDINDGPITDSTGNREHYFAYISARDSETELKTSEIEIPMIHGANHLLECFHFWFSIKHEGGIQSINVVQQDEELEDHPGIIEIIWEYTDTMVDDNNWIEGEVEVRAHYVDDIPQNYTLRWVAVSGKSKVGWAAVDDFSLIRTDGCMLKPSGAQPSSTTPTSTTPQESDLICDFETDFCSFQANGEGKFNFTRKTGNDASPDVWDDHNGNKETFFLFAKSDGDLNERMAYLKSDIFLGDDHEIECFHFWFNIDGFLGEAEPLETLAIGLEYESPRNTSIVWLYSKPTEGWMEGQIELRTIGHNGSFENWRIYIVVDKISDRKIFIALDDFTFRPSDICEVMPPDAWFGSTTANPETTSFNCGFQCEDGGCVKENQVCDFVSDCHDASDEKNCPVSYTFENCLSETGSENCGFEEVPVDNLDWSIATKTDSESSSHPIERDGKFLWIKKKTDNVSNELARVHSTEYQNSASSCIIRFFYTISEGLNGAFIKPGIHLVDEARDVFLDYLAETSGWEDRVIQIGRKHQKFEVIFEKDKGDYDAGVAIDDLSFEGCALPRPEESCPSELFQCNNKVCILNEYLCDVADDCGDQSDEDETHCKDFHPTTFEDGGFGLFTTQEGELFHWEIGSGSTDNKRTGPPFDHTLFDVTGRYVYINSEYQGENAIAELVSVPFLKSDDGKVCGMVFYSHMNGPLVGRLSVLLRLDDDNEIELFGIEGSQGNIWKRNKIEITNSTIFNSFRIVFKATIGERYMGDIALDDIVFDPNCRPGCSNDQFSCPDGKCLDKEKICDFRRDCMGGEDEAECPDFYDFEHCQSLEECHWKNPVPNSINWVISGVLQDVNGPNFDFENKTDGHFLYVSHGEKGESIAEIESSPYRNTNVDCYLSFYLYMSSPDIKDYVFPMMKHVALGMSTELDRFDLNSITDGMWTKVVIGLGRHRDLFTIVFGVVHNAYEYNAGIAIDDIQFFDCAVKSPQESCYDDQYHCEINKACVFKAQLCDFADDCGDNSDEVLEVCKDYTVSNFEDPELPFGFFKQDHPSADFQWSRGNGTTVNKQTGPPFDHTLFSPEGHYLFIASENQNSNERAYLITNLIKPSTQDCSIRFFVHLHGKGLGNLTLYSESALGELTLLWVSSEQAEYVDVNVWQRVTYSLESASEFRIVLEASVGKKGEGDIAIDDVSFTPACKFFDEPTTKTTEATTEHHTTEHHTTEHHTTERQTTTHFTTEPHTTHTTERITTVATAAPFDENKTPVTVIAVVAACLIAIILVSAGVYIVRSRNLNLPRLLALQSFFNPNYQRMEDNNMVSLKDLRSNQA